MTDLELIQQATETSALITDKLTLAARAIDALERRMDLFQAMLLHDPPHSHKDWASRHTPVAYDNSAVAPQGDDLDGLLD